MEILSGDAGVRRQSRPAWPKSFMTDDDASFANPLRAGSLAMLT